MEKQFEQINERLDILDRRVSSIDITLAIQSETLKVQADNLKEHMKRTKASEDRLAHLELSWERHLATINGTLLALKWALVASGALWSVLQIVDFLNKYN